MLRNLQRGGIYSVINIGGLAIGMAAAILIIAWIYHEWSYDRFHAKEKRLYVAYTRAAFDGQVRCGDWTPNILGPTLKADYPEIAEVARIGTTPEVLFSNGEAVFKIRSAQTDPGFLTMFDFPLLQGSVETALNDPYSVILTEKAAERLFGREDPMGRTLLVRNRDLMTVTGVMKDLPANTLFQFEALLPLHHTNDQNWSTYTLKTYVELRPDVRLDLVNESIRGIMQTHSNNKPEPELFLHPLGKQHLYSKFENGIPVGGELFGKMRLSGIIAGLILLIACINFVNLSTARSEKRAKEVGVRKVMGGKRLWLVKLFLGESMMVTFIAGASALILAMMALPVFSTLMEKQLTINPASGWFWLAGLGFVLFTGFLAGIYPAFYLSSFLPLNVLKGLFGRKQEVVSSRKILVVVQFTVASALIVSTLVIHRQIKYAQNRVSGYNKNQLIYTIMEGEISGNYELIKHGLLNSGIALSATKTHSPITARWSGTYGVSWRGRNMEELQQNPGARIPFDLFYADAGFAETVGATIIEGRDIDVYTYPTDSTAVLLNETAARLMNFENPVGEIIQTFARSEVKDWRVVGVVKDFIISSPYEPVNPMIISGPSENFNVMHIKLNDHNRMADNLAKAGQIFKQFNPAYPFEYQFVDEEYARKFQEEQKLGSLITWFAGLTIIISCMGLFALVAYMAESRKKEIGIRKVLGASVADVVFLLSKEFLILVLVSVAVASPVAWWVMNKWLADFAYRTDIPWWLFIVVGGMSLGIALLTVGFQAIKAATANPVKAIKAE
jgi:ABC-type antimicrobial peptide transport system permease subunit